MPSKGKNRHYDSYDTGPEWGTPSWVWEPLAEALGGFDLDPASGAEEKPIADTRWTIEDDGLSKEWYGDVWLNPPYGRSFNGEWGEKVSDEISRGHLDTLTALVPASTDTQWFQNHYANADTLTFIEGRIGFDGAGKSKASFASVIATWGSVPQDYIETLHSHGFVLHRTKRNCKCIDSEKC